MKACVNKDNCIGCGLCTAICSEVFFMEDDGKAKAVEGVINAALIDDTKEAAGQCPVAAIEIDE